MMIFVPSYVHFYDSTQSTYLTQPYLYVTEKLGGYGHYTVDFSDGEFCL